MPVSPADALPPDLAFPLDLPDIVVDGWVVRRCWGRAREESDVWGNQTRPSYKLEVEVSRGNATRLKFDDQQKVASTRLRRPNTPKVFIPSV